MLYAHTHTHKKLVESNMNANRMAEKMYFISRFSRWKTDQNLENSIKITEITPKTCDFTCIDKFFPQIFQ